VRRPIWWVAAGLDLSKNNNTRRGSKKRKVLMWQLMLWLRENIFFLFGADASCSASPACLHRSMGSLYR